MPIESIEFVVTGANPQTKTVQVNVDPVAGTGMASFVLSGTNSGTDSIQAFMASQNLSSNAAQVNWQQANGPIAIGPTTINFYSSSGGIYSGTGTHIGGPHTGNSLVFNQYYGNSSLGVPGFPITGFSTTNGDSGAYRRSPFSNQQQSNTGAWTSDLFFSEANAAFDGNYQGSFVVAAAGTYSFYIQVDDSWVMFIGGGAARNPATVGCANGSSVISKAGLSWVGGRLSVTPSINPPDMLVINFPTAGIYPLEIGHSQLYAGTPPSTKTYFVPTYVSGVGATPTVPAGQYGKDILPISSLQSIPPATATNTSKLALTPSGGATNLLVQGNTVTLTLQLSNITYTQKPYIPLLEGVPGTLAIYNSPTANTFSLPTFNGASVDSTALSSILSLSGDNTSYKNRLGINYDGSNQNLYYNGSVFDANVYRTNLTITDPDIAWYNSATKSFDLFAVTSQGGGSQLAIEVDYLVSPTIASISPSSLPANGYSVQFLLSLTKPLHPLQYGTAATFTGTGGITVTNSVANVNSSGSITGWTITATVPASSSGTTGTIVTTLSGAITYLSGSSFVNQTVTYLNAVATTINFTGNSLSVASNYSFSVTSGGQPAATYGFGASTTFTCTVQSTQSNFGTANFQFSRNGLGFGVLVSVSPTNIRQVGGVWLADYSSTVSTANLYATDSSGNGITYEFGYTEEQSDGTTVNYVDSNTYQSNNANPGYGGVPGGGGGGVNPPLPVQQVG